MAKQKPGNEHHRPGDEPEDLFPADETPAEDLVEMVDEDVVDVTAEDEVHDIVEVADEPAAPEPDIFDLTDAEAIPEPTTAGESGSGAKIQAPSDADLLAQLSAEENDEEVVHLTGESQEGRILPFSTEPEPASGIDVGLPVSEDSSNVDLAGLEADPSGSPSGVDVMDFGKADQPLGEGDSGAWKAPAEPTVIPRRSESTLDLGTLEPSEQPSGAGGISDVPINFTAGDEPLAREGTASAWETDAPPPAAMGGDQGSVIDLGVPAPTAPPGAVSDLRLMPEAMDSGMRLEGSADQPALSAGAGHGDMTEADLDLGALNRSPDIAEQIESNQHLPGGDDVVDLNEAAEEAIDDDSVDLGAEAEAAAEETPAADDDDAVDLGAPATETEEAPVGSEDIDPDMQGLADEFTAARDETASEEGAEEEEKPTERKTAKAEKKGGGIGGVLVGTVLGLLIGAGGLYGSLAGGVVDPAMLGLAPSKPTISGPGPGTRPPVAEDATPEKAHLALNSGDLDKAIEAFDKIGGEEPKVMASHGQALWLKSLQNLAKNNVDPAKFGEELKKDDGFNKAKEILTKAAEAKDADAVFWLAEIEEWTEGADKAKARIQAGLQEFANDPTQKQRFEAALNRLNLQPAAKPAGEARLRQPGGAWIALALVTMQMPPGIPGDPKPVADQEEAGDEFWKAIGLAQKRQYPQALEALDKAQKTHARMRLLRPKQQQNPRSDPMERIFLAACDEIRQRWQLESGSAAALAGLKDYDALAAELAAQKEPAKMLAALAAAVQAVAGEVSNAKLEKFDDPKKLKLADLPAAIKAGGLGGAGEKDKLDAVVAVLKNAKVDKFKDAAEGMAFTKEELAKGVQDVLGMVATEKAKAEEAVKALGEEKVKTDAALAALKDAKVEKAKDVAEGVKALAGERDKAQTELASANTTLDAVLKPLVENKHLPANAKRTDAPKGVTNLLATADHPAVRGLAEAVRELGSLGGKVSDEMLKGIDVRAQLVASSAENLKLRAQLMDRQSPEQMLALWRAALQGGADKATAELALKDAARMTDPSVKNQAQIITAMASRSQGKFDEARTALKGVKLPDGSPWQATADRLNAELKYPGEGFVPAIRKARDAGNLDRALQLADEALTAFPRDGFVKENATLRALHGLVLLEKALASGKVSPEVVKAAEADVAAALVKDVGETIEGNYLAGRVAEAEGDLPKAEAAYKAALAAYLAANPKSDEGLAAFHKDHPACDPIGNRYRVALARVIVGQRVGATPAAAPFTPPAPKEEKKPEAEVGRPSAALPSNPKVVLVADARKEAGVGLGEAPAVKVGLPAARPLPALVWVGGCPSVLSLPTLMVDPGVAIGEEDAGAPPDPRLDEAIRLAEEAVRLAKTSRDPRAFEAYLVLGEARARRGRWTEGLFDFVEGLKVLCPQYGPRLAVLVADHPAFKRPDTILPPDPLRAEGFFGRGLRLYFEGRYVDAEKEFLQAVRFHDQDARYLYFLGLSRLSLGMRDLAVEDFRLAARLETLDKPTRAAVSFSLERVQGPHRRFVNAFRDRAMREAVGVGP